MVSDDWSLLPFVCKPLTFFCPFGLQSAASSLHQSSRRNTRRKMFASTKQIVRAVPAMARGMANKNTTAKVFVDNNTRSDGRPHTQTAEALDQQTLRRRCHCSRRVVQCVMCVCVVIQRDLPGIHRKAGAAQRHRTTEQTDDATPPPAALPPVGDPLAAAVAHCLAAHACANCCVG